MPANDSAQRVVQYGIQTPHSRTILMVTENRDEAQRMLDMVGEGRLITRTIRYGSWQTVEEDLPVPF